MKITIKQIAEVAGVSRGTVDRALNGRKGVNKEVAEKVTRIANELGYHPNLAAKALADKRYAPKKIGVILNSEGNPFYDELIRGVNDALQKLSSMGIESVVKTAKGFQVERQLELIDELLEQNVNGIVLSAINSKRIARKLNQLYEGNIGVVTINTDVINTKRLVSIGCDYEKSGKVAAGLMGLTSNGSIQKIGVITGSNMVLAHAMRVRGIKEVFRKEFTQIQIIGIAENEDNDEISYDVTKKMLGEHPDLMGVIFVAAGIEGGIKAVKELHLNGKLKIITYDLPAIARKSLEENVIMATICQEPYRQGYLGVDIMGDYLLKGEVPAQDIIYTENTIVTKYSL